MRWMMLDDVDEGGRGCDWLVCRVEATGALVGIWAERSSGQVLQL